MAPSSEKKSRLVLSSGFPFTALWKPHSPQPDNSSRCLDGVQIAAYSLHSVRKSAHVFTVSLYFSLVSAFILTPTPSFTHPLVVPIRLFPLPGKSLWEPSLKDDSALINVVTEFCDCNFSLHSLQFSAFQYQLNCMLRWESYLLQSASLLWLILLW